jgi:hypothetical protein
MGPVKGSDARRVRELEGINGLILVTDHDELPCFGEEVEENLLGPIEVLILVNQNVLEHAAVGRGRILSEIAERLGDELAYEYGLVESEPPDEFPMKGPVDGVLRPAGSVGLEARPGRIERLEAAVTVTDSSEAITVQVFEQEPLLETQEGTRDATGGFENLISTQQTKAESV